jgi:peptide/nickel transport system substrate-binding protein
VALLAVSSAGGAAIQQTPKRGGTLVYRLIGPEPACLNVLDERCAVPTLWFLLERVLERPLAVGRDFTYQPAIVSKVAFTRRRPFTLTYRIRPEARWSDGVPITAQDFVFTLRAIRAHGLQQDRDLHAAVRSAHVVDRKTLRVVLVPKMAHWRDLFGNILPSHALRGADLTKIWSASLDDPRTGRPIGSGPFLVERWERGEQLTLRRNPRYWGSRAAYLDRIVIRFAAVASDPVSALKSGELDVATGVPPVVVPAVRREAGLRLVATATSAFEQLSLQRGPNGHPALRSKLVRRALAYGIDRVAMVRQIYGEVDPTFRVLDSTVHVPQSRYYEANWSAYRYRPAQSRRLLEQAGCRRGSDGIYSCAGKRLSLRFITSVGSQVRAQALGLVQARLRAVGVEAVPVFASPGAFFAQILPEGNFDVALFSGSYTPSGSWADVYGCGRKFNFTGYCQRLVTADLDEADRILGERQRARVFNRADRRLAGDVPTIPLYQFVATAAHGDGVKNWALVPWNPFWNAEDWWLER